MRVRGVLLTLFLVCSVLCAFSSLSCAAGRAPQVTLDHLNSAQLDTVLAKLSDEQVRSLLIAQLHQGHAVAAAQKDTNGGVVASFGRALHLLDGSEENDFVLNLKHSLRQFRALPDDFNWTIRQLAQDASLRSAGKNLVMVLGIFLFAFMSERLFRVVLGRLKTDHLEPLESELSGLTRFGAAVLYQLPALVHLLVFAAVALFAYFWSPFEELLPLRYVFMALLFAILGIRLVVHLSHLFCAPSAAMVRVLPLSDGAARRLHLVIVFLSSYLLIALLALAALDQLGMQSASVTLLAVVLATLLLVCIALVALANRHQVAKYLGGEGESKGATAWLMRQFSARWHVLLLGYLLVVWFFLLENEFSAAAIHNGAFLLSLFIIPVFLILDRVAGWIVQSVVRAMRIYDLPAEDGETEGAYGEELAEQRYKEQQLVLRCWRVARLGLLLTLLLWMLSLWGYRIPHVGAIIRATFDILLTLLVALIFWRVTSSYIERKIEEATPKDESEQDQDDEWGAAATRGRGYTLFPMVRKFLGTVLIVMVTLIVLSSLGVDIGPLLAGAGVVGLAIGFGAQKLVSDVFSGFFYLLDDAFRVGEYLQAGSVSGAVEAITLRNVMLRHHRGMLQIVPYSELGSITNFMRGGIVVKFNLEFPYDSNIDKIRKIIKKVGQAMLEDEEFGKDFIRPVKSQGVREISNSVMIIRVKFTAQPGTHFVIRREAYRRITEALAAQGIHYAHRKVIVEIPAEEGDSPSSPTSEQSLRALEAGAAAAQAAMAKNNE